MCRLAIDLELASPDLWREIFIHYPLGDDLLNIARHLNLKKWFNTKVKKDPTLRGIFVQIWSASLTRAVENGPGVVVEAVYEFRMPFLLDISGLVESMVKLEYYIPALQLVVKSKLFDRRRLLDLVVSKIPLGQLLQAEFFKILILGKISIFVISIFRFFTKFFTNFDFSPNKNVDPVSFV